MERGLTTGQLAKQVGVNVETLRYYERLHLLTPTTRMPSGYCVYGPTALHRLRFIKNRRPWDLACTRLRRF